MYLMINFLHVCLYILIKHFYFVYNLEILLYANLLLLV